MITRYGMSDDFGMVALETVNNQYLGGETTPLTSEATQTEIDKQVVAIVQEQYEIAEQTMRDNREKLDELSEFLYHEETITGEQFMEILNA